MIIPHETIKKDLLGSDLDRFVELYKSFGIECVVYDTGIGRYAITLMEHLELYTLQGNIEDFKDETWNYSDKFTYSKKFTGYSGFFSDISFDKDGKFLEQAFFE